jgi:hypothetical protein
MSGTELRCDRTELPVSMCAHCRGHDDPMKLSTGEFGVPFIASYDGRCGACDGRIRVGEITARLAAGGYGCERCLP